MIWLSNPLINIKLPNSYQSKGLTIRTTEALEPQLLAEEIHSKIASRAAHSTLTTPQGNLFCKQRRIGGIKKRIKYTFSESIKSTRQYMEICNNLEAEGSTHTPRLRAIAIQKEHGLTRSIVIATDLLENHENLEEHLFLNPEKSEKLTRKSLILMKSMNSEQVHHLDLRIGNIMLSSKTGKLSAIDLEYCYTKKPRNPNEILGFQLGFMYSHTLRKFISEEKYLSIVREVFTHHTKKPDVERLYKLSKETTNHSCLRHSLLKSLTT